MLQEIIYQQPFLVFLSLIVLVIWDLIWKSLALWHSARKSQKGWFISLLIINSLGILPIIYLIWFKNKKPREATQVRVTGSVSRNKPKKKRKN